MHLCLEGALKTMLNLWFLSQNNKCLFYLLPSIDRIDKVLKCFKLPSEGPRSQRSISFYRNFKANEYRNLVFYSLIFALRDIPDPNLERFSYPYYENFCRYVMFLRLLTQEKVKAEDTQLARELITTFLHDFNILYGGVNITYNLHAHLHLPDQVDLLCSLEKCCCFPREACFKECKKCFSGTTNIPEQVAYYSSLKNKLKAYLTPEKKQRFIISIYVFFIVIL